MGYEVYIEKDKTTFITFSCINYNDVYKLKDTSRNKLLFSVLIRY